MDRLSATSLSACPAMARRAAFAPTSRHPTMAPWPQQMGTSRLPPRPTAVTQGTACLACGSGCGQGNRASGWASVLCALCASARTPLRCPARHAPAPTHDRACPARFCVAGAVSGRTCDNDGLWQGDEVPSCVPVACASLLAPEHSSVQRSNDSRFPSTATYVCDAGFLTTDTYTLETTRVRGSGARAHGWVGRMGGRMRNRTDKTDAGWRAGERVGWRRIECVLV